VLIGSGELIDSMTVVSALGQSGFECMQVRDIKRSQKEAFFAADVGISQADCLVAETGSIFVRASPQEPRSLSLLPPVHVVLTQASAVVGDLFDVFEGPWAGLDALPTSMVLITGPSKTGDIELRLVTGVHGPGEVHVILLTTPP
jgi:L-lactate utilization protein LutC